MRGNRLLVAVLIAIPLLGLGFAGGRILRSRTGPPSAPTSPEPPRSMFDRKVVEFFGAEVCRIVEQAERVEVQRLAQGLRDKPMATGEPVRPTGEWVQRLRALLGRAGTYAWSAKPCMPNWGVVVMFMTKEEQVNLLLCFECTILSLAEMGQNQWQVFDPALPAFVRLVQEVFPEDPVIQGLKEQDS